MCGGEGRRAPPGPLYLITPGPAPAPTQRYWPPSQEWPPERSPAPRHMQLTASRRDRTIPGSGGACRDADGPTLARWPHTSVPRPARSSGSPKGASWCSGGDRRSTWRFRPAAGSPGGPGLSGRPPKVRGSPTSAVRTRSTSPVTDTGSGCPGSKARASRPAAGWCTRARPWSARGRCWTTGCRLP